MKHQNLRHLLLLFLSLGTGCASVPLDQAFRANKPVVAKPVTEALLVVVGEDSRPLAGMSRVGRGALSLIPLIPYGHQQFSAKPNVAGSFSREVADTVVKDLRAAGFAEFVAIEDAYDPRQRDVRRAYYVRVNLAEGVWDRYITAYGISFAGELLWMAGFPISYGKAVLGIEVEVLNKDRVSLGKRLFKEKVTVIEWLYHPLVHSFTPKLAEAYEQFSPQLRAFVSETIGNP
jgi:hypothetical protein